MAKQLIPIYNLIVNSLAVILLVNVNVFDAISDVISIYFVLPFTGKGKASVYP